MDFFEQQAIPLGLDTAGKCQASLRGISHWAPTKRDLVEAGSHPDMIRWELGARGPFANFVDPGDAYRLSCG
eukprot:CAMPEP_0174285042 /NCGR_PEP_ID=MMETSP0809-20121228/7487_1 /TAXON_ID=73025 ORGANISM="Eutreptiella gymnastica-like, Strain CCMP1594" /NCGR_SAMPLE_ID=MMETSP0809 /ASSEMBLY_ACC=CAM_ASM_000658 /LENGTH=71 /DNA_ID=CAMNT_0015380725 /DNA_START=704 /DNA_END=919 /DNA_ORIENTATION=+